MSDMYPLVTWQLHDMDGLPVFLEIIYRDGSKKKEWAIVDAEHFCCRTKTAYYSFCDMGKLWSAYVAEPIRYAVRTTVLNNVFTGRPLITCSKCSGKVAKKDKYCKHCGALLVDEIPIEGE